MTLNHKLQDVLDRVASGEEVTEVTLSHGTSFGVCCPLQFFNRMSP